MHPSRMRLFTKKQFPLLLSAGYRFSVLHRKSFFVWLGALHGLRLMSRHLNFIFFLLRATFKMRKASYFLRAFFVMHPSKML